MPDLAPSCTMGFPAGAPAEVLAKLRARMHAYRQHSKPAGAE